MTGREARELVTIRTCRDLQEAQLIRSMLEAVGIDAFIPDEHFAGLYPVGVLNTNGVRVQVDADVAAIAEELLEHEEPSD
jgi:hypothetical protein